MGGAGASVAAVYAGVTAAAAGGCLGGVHGDVEPPWWGWWGAGWAATRQVPISGFFPYLILIELFCVVQVTPPALKQSPTANRWGSEAHLWCAGKVIASCMPTVTNMMVQAKMKSS